MVAGSLAGRIEASTPAGRDRYVDFLRVGSIVVVVLGHWLLAVVTVRGGRLHADHLLAVAPAAQWLTWGFQVMPLFFFVGGYANAVAWTSARRKGVETGDWVRQRARRLLRPTVPLVVVWVPLAAALAVIGTPTDLVTLGSQAAFVPTWFLAAYLVVVALVPVTFAAHRRYGWAALGVLVVTAAAVDALHLGLGVPVVGWTNFLWVWMAVHQLGYLWHDGRLPGSVVRSLGLAVVGFATLLALTRWLGYPLSMVGVPGALRSNNTPPTVALVALGAGQVGLVLAARRPIERWLRRPVVWAGVALGGSRIMTVYLWHQTAMIAVAAAAYPTGIWPATGTVDAAWWLTRPLWFAVLGSGLAVLVVAFGRFERPSRVPPPALPGGGAVRAAVGVALTTLGLALLVVGGLYSPTGVFGVPVIPVTVLLMGLAALGVIGVGLGRSPGSRLHVPTAGPTPVRPARPTTGTSREDPHPTGPCSP